MEYGKFKNPNKSYLPAPFWSWNDKLQKKELGRQIDEMIDKGWGSYFIHTRVGLITNYLSEEWFDLVKFSAQKSYKKGVDCWLYDEDKWPSGFAGGLVPAADDNYRTKTLVLVQKGQLKNNDEVMKTVKWQDEEYMIAIRRAEAGDVWFNGESYVDLLNPETVQKFIEVTHEKYKEKCGDLFGEEIKGIFTDEACFHLDIWFDVPALPWSEYLEEKFNTEKKYNLINSLPSLFFPIDNYEKVRYDFFDVASRLFLESFTKPYYSWCDKNKLLLTGHLMSEDNLLKQTKWLGMVMPHYKYMHWPGIDKLGRNIGDNVLVKQLTSVKEQLNKERALSEVFGTSGQQVSFFHRKWLADWEAVLGIDYVNHHLSLYSMRGERKRDFPPNFFYQQPWWPDEDYCSKYLGRLSMMAGLGNRDTDILLLHPIASLWSIFSPVNNKNNNYIEKGRFDKPFKDLTDGLLKNKLDFHYGDELILNWEARLEECLKINQYSYKTIIIPPSLTWRQTTVDILLELSNMDSVELIFLGELPTRINGEKAEYKEIFNKSKIFVKLESLLIYLDKKYDDRFTVIDNKTRENAKSILIQTRIKDREKYTMIVNTEEEREIESIFNYNQSEKYQVVYDLATGEKYNWQNQMVRLEPGGSMLLSTEDNTGLKNPDFLESGVIVNDLKSRKINIKRTNIAVNDENTLPLQDIDFYLNNEKVLIDQPISKVWHDHFYPAEEGTVFKAVYNFNIKDLPEKDLFAVIELAENLDLIKINSETIKPLKKEEAEIFETENCWKDINFTKVPIKKEHLQLGENKLIIKGSKINNITGKGFHRKVKDPKKHFATEVEKVYLVGDFSVETQNNKEFYISSNKKIKSNNLTKEGFPFYSGTASFKYEFIYDGNKLNKKLFLQINEVNAASVKLIVNNKSLGIRAWPPYLYQINDYLKEGRNEIELIIKPTLFNLMGPNRWQGILEKEFVGPGTFVDFNKYTDKFQLLPFGIDLLEILELENDNYEK